jgi:hypothetical protein
MKLMIESIIVCRKLPLLPDALVSTKVMIPRIWRTTSPIKTPDNPKRITKGNKKTRNRLVKRRKTRKYLSLIN